MQTMNFRSLLTEEFVFRQNENPSYSMRAFARDLQLTPSQMSEVLGGKTGLSSKKAIIVGQKLGLSEKEIIIFKAMVEVEHGRSPQIIANAKRILDESRHSGNFKNLSMEGFKFISEWIYFPILSTMELDDYDGSINFIVKRLNLTQAEAEEAIKTLLKLDIIDIKDSKFIISGEMFTTSHDIESQALKKFHKQHLRRAMEAVDNISVKDRDITTMTMAIDKKKLPEAKDLIKDFRRSLCKLLEAGEKNEVYNLNIQLIPLTNLEKK